MVDGDVLDILTFCLPCVFLGLEEANATSITNGRSWGPTPCDDPRDRQDSDLSRGMNLRWLLKKVAGHFGVDTNPCIAARGDQGRMARISINQERPPQSLSFSGPEIQDPEKKATESRETYQSEETAPPHASAYNGGSIQWKTPDYRRN